MNSHRSYLHFARRGIKLLPLLPLSLLVSGSIIDAEPGSAQPVQVECITPDGQVLPLVNGESNPAAALKNDGTIHCPLRAGETVFIIALPTAGMLGLRFINENAAASGELKIAVSKSWLPADSPKWTAVEGAIPFVHKRLFELSMLGVEASYVRLLFRVDKPGTINGVSIDPHALRQAASLASN